MRQAILLALMCLTPLSGCFSSNDSPIQAMTTHFTQTYTIDMSLNGIGPDHMQWCLNPTHEALEFKKRQ